MGYELFTVDRRDDGVAVVTMSRPHKLNAMNQQWFRELPAILHDLDAASGVRACVLTGEGRAFSAGGDMEMFEALEDLDAVRANLRLVYDSFHSVERAATPIVGAVNGIAFGGGTELALACDIAIASTAARFAFKEVTVGLMPGYGVIRGPDVIGKRWTRRLAMTGEDIGADKALEIGLVDEVVEPAELLPRALEIAGAIAAHPPTAVRMAKQFINRDQQAPGQPESIEATALLHMTDEHQRRVARFLEGHRPAKETLPEG